jgi:hypothetical protein
MDIFLSPPKVLAFCWQLKEGSGGIPQRRRKKGGVMFIFSHFFLFPILGSVPRASPKPNPNRFGFLQFKIASILLRKTICLHFFSFNINQIWFNFLPLSVYSVYKSLRFSNFHSLKSI